MAFCLVARVLGGPACARTPAAVKAWDDEVTGAVAQVNDAVALELLLGLVDVPKNPTQQVVDPQGATPDLVRVGAARARPDGAECPPRLRDTVRTCTEA